ncbi:MAG: outer membrane protein assembly factor BamD [Planctomycetota bacterium]
MSGAVALSIGGVAGGWADAQEVFELSEDGWERQATPDPDTPRGQMAAIRRALASAADADSRGDGRRVKRLANEARGLATTFIKERPNDPLIPEAYLRRGDALVLLGQYYKSLFDYEFVAQAFPQSDMFLPTLEREYQVARLLLAGQRIPFLGLPLLTARSDGEELMIRIQERAPGSAIGERASLALSDYYFDRGVMDQASIAYELFLQNYPQSTRREWAMLRLIQANLARFRGPRFDTTGLIEARQRLEEYREAFPAAADRIGVEALEVRIDESLALRDLTNAGWYEKRGQRISAAILYRRIVDEFPQTAAARSAVTRLRGLDLDLTALPPVNPNRISPTGNTTPLAPTTAPR